MSRPKGSKNKPKGNTQKEFSMEENTLAPNSGCPTPKRGRGRPKGSGKKITVEPTLDSRNVIDIFGSKKNVKAQIRALRKLKKQCRAGTSERIELHRKIRDLQAGLEQVNMADTGKDTIIEEILRLDKVMASIEIDLRKHKIEDLQKYLDKLKGVK